MGGVYPLMGQDELYVYWNGGGGYGDPLDRQPEYVARDFSEGLISRFTAHEIYGVVLGDEGELYKQDTLTRREQLKKERIT